MSLIEGGIVDSHFHLQKLGSGNYPWLEQARRDDGLEGALDPIAHDFLADDYAHVVDRLGIIAAVHVENGWRRDRPVEETSALMQQLGAGQTSLPYGLVAFADLRNPDLGSFLGAQQAAGPVRGIRQILNRHSDTRLSTVKGAELMVDPKWVRGFAQLAALELSFDLQIYPGQMDAAHRLLSDFAETSVILDHIGMPIDRSAAGLRSWRKSIVRLADCPNLCVKLSGGFLGAGSAEIGSIVALFGQVIDIFGADRVMLGSNLPVDRLYGGVDVLTQIWSAVLSNQPSHEMISIARMTAQRIYQL